MQAYQKIILLLFASAYLITISSCCKKKVLEEKVESIVFQNFDEQELDTIVVEWYNKEAPLSPPFDSSIIFYEYFSLGPGDEIIPLPKSLTVGFDYKVKLVSTGRSFTVSDFVVQEENLFSEGLGCGGKQMSIVGYKVNGQIKESQGPLVVISN